MICGRSALRAVLGNLDMPEDKKPNNLRIALILLVIVLAFFVSPFIKRLWLS